MPLGLLAVQIVTARDARRFVGGLLVAIALNFVVLYPNISALPLPGSIVPWYQGVLPTYLYMFQFGVNTTSRGATSFSDPKFPVLVVALLLAVAGVAYSAWTWRQALAEDLVSPGDGDGGPDSGAGPDGGTSPDVDGGSGGRDDTPTGPGGSGGDRLGGPGGGDGTKDSSPANPPDHAPAPEHTGTGEPGGDKPSDGGPVPWVSRGE